LFDDAMWKSKILPFIEHPQFTRPEEFMNMTIPEVLKTGDHKQIAKWREQGWKE
jgi:tRNA (guanine-N1)-methyltransferase